MKKTTLVPVFIIAASFIFLTYKPALARVNSLLFQSACTKPIKYQIGTIDPRFGVSKSKFKTDIEKGEAVWEKTFGQNLFEYNLAAGLKINLVFDERQQNFDKTKSISEQVKKIGGQLDQLGNKLAEGKSSLEPEVKAYQERVQAFNQRVQKLDSDIQYWNSQGGAPPEEYERINNERDALSKEAEALNKRAEELNRLKQEYNKQVSQYNNDLSQLNQKTGQLNQSIESLQDVIDEKPEEGLYDPKLNKIDIYFNIDQAGLIQTLAHELGHARGLGHNENKKSIMYAFTNKESTPSAEDLRGLEEVCKEKSLPEIFVERLKLNYQYFYNLFQSYL